MTPGVADQPSATPPRRRWRQLVRRGLLGLFVIYLAVLVYQSALKPLPPGLSVAGTAHPIAAADIEFLYDLTYGEGSGPGVRQTIFDRVLQLIREAEDVVVLDLFLFNDYLGRGNAPHRKVSGDVVAALLEKRRTRPDLPIIVITDPVNEAYGGSVLPLFTALREAGIQVVFTRLDRLRDSNATYSAFWRMFLQWTGASPGGSLPHPFARDAGGIGARSWFALLNFKANHRKLVIADAPGPAGSRVMTALVMSANPHDGSSAHSNVALVVRGGEVWRDLWESERAVLQFSAPEIDLAAMLPGYANSGSGVAAPDATASADHPTVRVLTEGKIRRELLALLDAAGTGDTIDVAMFYLGDRKVVNALVRAAQRDVAVRVVLDPNRDAFGYKKNGVPNVPVAAELLRRGAGRVAIRWYDTHGEQFHTKLVLVRHSDGRTTVLAGSANLTRRNIGDFNLETNLLVAGASALPSLREAGRYFDAIWSNAEHACTVPYETYADRGFLKRWQYRVQEATGLGTF